jgi:hypothetical protein
MFHLSLSSGTGVSLVTTFLRACPFACRYVLAQMFHFSLSSGTDVSLVSKFWHRCFACPCVLERMFSRLSLTWHTLLHLLPHSGTHLVSPVTTLETEAAKYIHLKKNMNRVLQPPCILESDVMHSVKCASKFQKNQGLIYTENCHRFL